MLLMEGNWGSEAQRGPTPPVAADNHHLTRPDSDSSSLTAENCQGFFRRSKNLTPDECTAWTNDKHNSYLYDLEMSFVEQLYQSKSVLARCSGHNLIDLNISQKQIINLNDASHKHKDSCNGCWQKVKCAGGEPIPCSTSADYHASLESERTHHSKHRGVNCHPSPAKIPALLKHKGTWEQGKGMISHGIQTCSKDSIDLTTEGTGQNFSDEDNQRELDTESHTKRLKTAIRDGLHQDQIVPSSECTPAPVINSSTRVEQF